MTVELMYRDEVARLFNVDPRTVTRWEQAGRLGCIRTRGGHRRFFAAEVRAILAGQRLTQAQVRALRLQAEAEAAAVAGEL